MLSEGVSPADMIMSEHVPQHIVRVAPPKASADQSARPSWIGVCLERAIEPRQGLLSNCGGGTADCMGNLWFGTARCGHCMCAGMHFCWSRRGYRSCTASSQFTLHINPRAVNKHDHCRCTRLIARRRWTSGRSGKRLVKIFLPRLLLPRRSKKRDLSHNVNQFRFFLI